MYYILGELSLMSKEDQKTNYRFYLYIGIVIGSSILIAINYLCHVSLFCSASKNLHASMVWKLLRAPMQFFDTNSIGTILTKFTKDIESLDDFMPNSSFFALKNSTQLIASMIAMSIAVPFIIIILVIVLAIIWMIKRFVSHTLQKLEWLESYNRGAINTKLSSIIDGLITVRAYSKQQYFLNEFLKESDKVSSIAFTYFGWLNFSSQWMDVSFFFLCLINTFLVIIFKLCTDWFSNNALAISVTTSTNIYITTSVIILIIINVENQMKIIKNCLAYATMESEAELDLESDPPNLQNGKVEFKDVWMKYKGTAKSAL